MRLVVDKGGQDRTLRFQMLVIDGCSETHKIRDACGESEIIGVGIELVPFEIITQRGTPVGEQFEYIGCREIHFLLLIAIIHRQLRRVFVYIVGVVVSIFRQPPCAETVADVLIESRLHEGIQILLALTPSPHIIDDSPRNTSSGVIEIALHLPTALIESPKEIRLNALSVDITVLSDSRRIPSGLTIGVTTLIAELILATGRQEACTHRRAYGL